MAASAPMPTSDNVVQQGLPGGSRRASLKHEHAARPGVTVAGRRSRPRRFPRRGPHCSGGNE